MRKASKRSVPSVPTPTAGIVKLGDVLPQLIARFGLQQKKNVEAIGAAWRKTVGEPYGSISRVVGLTRGTLTVSVPHNAFVQELSFRQKELLSALQTALPTEKIKKIKFIVS